ncbi:MAG: hypothetical protein ACQESD_00195, partial [Thermoplasmatota archaeon]
MDGLRIGGQHLYNQGDMAQTKNTVQSILHGEDMDVEYLPNGGMEGKSTLNSIEVNFIQHQGGTRVEVDHGITTVGVILGVILLMAFVLGGIIVLLFWYMKYDDLKDALKRAFPGYIPPAGGYGQAEYQ